MVDTPGAADKVMACFASLGRVLADVPGADDAVGPYLADVALDPIILLGTVHPLQKDQRTTAKCLVTAAGSCVLYQYLLMCNGQRHLCGQLPVQSCEIPASRTGSGANSVPDNRRELIPYHTAYGSDFSRQGGGLWHLFDESAIALSWRKIPELSRPGIAGPV